MTKSLCLHCGGFKIGAFSPCHECGNEATGNEMLDILFRDNLMASSTLDNFSRVIKTINAATPDPILRHNAFFVYISDNHSSLLNYELDSTPTETARGLLSTLSLPTFEILPGIRNRPKPEKPPPQRATPLGDNGNHKPWWQFWKHEP